MVVVVAIPNAPGHAQESNYLDVLSSALVRA
jgi:hypothetical protein